MGPESRSPPGLHLSGSGARVDGAREARRVREGDARGASRKKEEDSALKIPGAQGRFEPRLEQSLRGDSWLSVAG
ncbi:hypothetical protein CDD80_2630 [Ophiocordyceps camponoti-rufipedis]|uniref:Uncharacterized protein n=1 Tax=Ophiocordyceps camponoti-rufipedis TaxID=2004952 RepID=A0A2C5Z5P5_9HYPO|nr:hypothetical protein CDD80_2630 [Ophiocordyceps camponoti-rufipedis]